MVSANIAALRPRPTLADRLRKAVMALALGHGRVMSHSESAWASITFSGTRHELVIRFDGSEAVAAGEQLLERLPEHEFTLAGQLVADAAVTSIEHRFAGADETLEVRATLLLLEED